MSGSFHDIHRFYFGGEGSAWICIRCEKQLGGSKNLSDEERTSLVEFLKESRASLAKTRKAQKEKSMKLELGIMAGPESKAFLADLTKIVERMERAVGAAQGQKTRVMTEDADTEVEDEETEIETAAEADDEEELAPKAKKKAAASFDEEEDEEEEEVEAAPTKKATKAKKLTVDDVNDACLARARATGGKKGRDEVLAILKKKFKTQSVSGLKPEQYADAIAAMQA